MLFIGSNKKSVTMTETLTKHERNLAAIIHASTLTKYFIPFGNFPLALDPLDVLTEGT